MVPREYGSRPFGGEGLFVCEGRVNLIVRTSTEADIPTIVDLWWETMDFHARLEPRFQLRSQPEAMKAWEKHLRENILEHDDWHVLVAEVDDRIVGMMIGSRQDPYPIFEPERYGFLSPQASGELWGAQTTWTHYGTIWRANDRSYAEGLSFINNGVLRQQASFRDHRSHCSAIFVNQEEINV